LVLTLFFSVIGPYWIKPLVQSHAMSAPSDVIVHQDSSLAATTLPPNNQQSSANAAAKAKAEVAKKDADAQAYLEKVLGKV